MIDKLLLAQGDTLLGQAIATVYNGRYYLCVYDKVYIADSRYRFQEEHDYSYQYEWWVWDNIEATAIGVIGGVLYFGDKDGRLCYFGEDYEDRKVRNNRGRRIVC